jgi:hypothetical protein
MLISMFHSLKRILAETLGIAKTVKKIQDNQEHGVELLNILSSKQPSVSKPTTSSDPSSVSKRSDNQYCLWCWVVVCIFCGFVAALFIASVFLSLIISLTEPVLEPQCEKIERQLSNGETSTWGISSSSISILDQDEEGTTVIMPCDGIAIDEVGNEYQVDGAYKLSCDPSVTFNYITRIGSMKKEIMVIAELKGVGVVLCAIIVVNRQLLVKQLPFNLNFVLGWKISIGSCL